MPDPLNITPDFEVAETFMLQTLQQELSSSLTYHGYHHTLDVMQAAVAIAATEHLSAEETGLLRVAVAFHDAGFIHTYKNHEARSCELAKEFLPAFGFTKKQIDCICSMVMATKIPQLPKTKLEYIICDADLDYLGREDVIPIAETLYKELNIHIKPMDEKTWDEVQIAFLKSHHYHTAYATKHRQQNKIAYLNSLMEKWKD
jgi:exopolyphosphatase/pppGpp-phosphohydrolase